MASCYRFIVSGRVQGVYFRQSTQQRASELGLSGWVRNLADGRVEGLASGQEQALSQLLTWLRRGPAQAQVESVTWLPDAETTSGSFEVRR